MTTIAYSPVNIQTSAQSVPSIPNWFGEITLLAHHLQQPGGACCHRRTGALCPSPFWALRGDRFCRRALRLCRQRRTDAGSLLRVPSTLGRRHSWPCSDATACQPVRRSRVFSPRWIRPQSSPCAPCFSKICWLVLW